MKIIGMKIMIVLFINKFQKVLEITYDNGYFGVKKMQKEEV